MKSGGGSRRSHGADVTYKVVILIGDRAVVGKTEAPKANDLIGHCKGNETALSGSGMGWHDRSPDSHFIPKASNLDIIIPV